MRASIVLVTTIALLALACGGESESPGADVSAAPESASPAAPSPAPSATAPSPAATSADAAVAECRSLAAKQEWALALDPCTRAAQQLPDDLEIRHALQQAQAAAADSARRAMGAAGGVVQ